MLFRVTVDARNGALRLGDEIERVGVASRKNTERSDNIFSGLVTELR